MQVTPPHVGPNRSASFSLLQMVSRYLAQFRPLLPLKHNVVLMFLAGPRAKLNALATKRDGQQSRTEGDIGHKNADSYGREGRLRQSSLEGLCPPPCESSCHLSRAEWATGVKNGEVYTHVGAVG